MNQPMTAVREVSRRVHVSTVLVGLLFGLSGVPALIDQVAWQRVLAFHSGVGSFSVTVIVAATMAGLGIGGLIGGALSKGLCRRRALVAFAMTELSIGLFAAFGTHLYYEMPFVPDAWFRGASFRVATVHFLALLPPTTLMGMTFPLLVRAMVRDASGAAGVIGWLYGVNILGAAAGAILTPWVLVPWRGLPGAVLVGVGCNVVVGLGSLAAWSFMHPDERVDSSPFNPEKSAVGAIPTRPFPLWLGLYALSGFVAVALEVVWFRMIDVGAKSTAYTFGTVLAVYLVGLGAGTLAGARLSSRWSDPLGAFLTCQCGALLATGLAVVLIVRSSPDAWWLRSWSAYWGGYEPVSPRSSGLLSTLSLYAGLPTFLYGLPTLLMGLSFGALQKGVQDDPRTSGLKVGLLQGANIAGCVAGCLAVGLVGFERIGTAGALRWAVALGVGLAALGALATTRRLRFVGLGAVLGLVAAVAPDQGALWARLHGVRGGTALIAEDAAGVAALLQEGGRWRVSANGKGQSYLPFGGVHSKLGALPATLHPAPESVAVIGLGSGDTAWAASRRPETREVTVFETCPAQRGLLERLADMEEVFGLKDFLDDPRVNVVEADGRHALATSDATYELIEADAVRPNGAYAGNLYSLEFFEICKRKLKPGGLMCTWSPTPRTRSTFRRAFPHVLELDGGVILIGSASPIRLDVAAWTARLSAPEVAARLGPEAFDECLRAVPTARPLPPEAEEGPDQINTDLFPRDEYERPLDRP